MSIKRGEVWLADLNPTRGSEQGGTRPVIAFQNEIISQWIGQNCDILALSWR